MEAALKEENFENPDLKATVKSDNPLKDLFVTYVGNKLQPKDDNVTVEMIIDVLAEEFPEFMLVVAEENFIRGYRQAFADLEAAKEEDAKAKKNKRRK